MASQSDITAAVEAARGEMQQETTRRIQEVYDAIKSTIGQKTDQLSVNLDQAAQRILLLEQRMAKAEGDVHGCVQGIGALKDGSADSEDKFRKQPMTSRRAFTTLGKYSGKAEEYDD